MITWSRDNPTKRKIALVQYMNASIRHFADSSLFTGSSDATRSKSKEKRFLYCNYVKKTILNLDLLLLGVQVHQHTGAKAAAYNSCTSLQEKAEPSYASCHADFLSEILFWSGPQHRNDLQTSYAIYFRNKLTFGANN